MRFKERQKPKIGMDLTPLIDVVFLLLIFFIVSTTFVANPGILVNLPKASARPVAQKPETIEVTLTQDHRIYLEGQEVAPGQLQDELVALTQGKGTPGLIIRADGAAQHQRVVEIMDAAYKAGVTRLSVATLDSRP
ncbi:MAG: hypothetical protein A2600_11050 [Candidatus Lambdaproteobacteria bacterium RIFOXYD1_FULL_56_27]|uniref:Biopolymer transporter ExbD n=1 Tax=Candidatus Lambdaproteobacteria bacterium RIFOXYD2_FULL_56_26 TaxID=1817773 RepID=A0A1F6H1N8_9PROT|nr:MAG: hypothetical protein A2557_10795 [Candidatus Lambdaproteobacteria bacterium RIFOXYD2_FULL_56_26]OGH05692.1 MAG: hypothetical protein A2426_04135 [Candidatus Lambdaproteobacteria bacterium RIFOXYC1_FULL_56_13]OGH08441.1 MAG: hypothetical protein A2600_11050 [Candidatus Lambdaproteobacteria bacterium RIFOXYD1_FULL_56_27]